MNSISETFPSGNNTQIGLLKETFVKLASTYTDNIPLINELWAEIEAAHSAAKRHYHSLRHLENLLYQLQAVRDHINNWDVVLFTLYYHDIVYNPLKDNNEEKSAELAEARLSALAVPAELTQRCKQQILATKKHLPNTDPDTNYFTDADLSVLGQDWPLYAAYAEGVRKEYSIYPDLIYKPGRKKVLQHFLQMERIFKTDYFYHKLETSAKRNLQQELEGL
jgi:predicted metal-dependent HD superfamily phosphohydrolase